MIDDSLTADLVHVAGRSIRMLTRDPSLETLGSVTPALSVIKAEAPITVSDFARHYGCTQPSASQLLAKLDRHGWVVRTTSATDGRVRNFALTPAGERQLTDARARAAELLSPALRQLPESDLAALRRVITALEDVLDARASTQVTHA